MAAVPPPLVTSAFGSLLVPALKTVWHWIELVRGEHTSTQEITNTLRHIRALIDDTGGDGEINNTVRAVRNEGTYFCDFVERVIDLSTHHWRNSHVGGPLSCPWKYTYNISHTCSLCMVASEVAKIQAKADHIINSLTPFAANRRNPGGTATTPAGRMENRHLAPLITPANFVGMGEYVESLYQLLVSGEEGKKVITVDGMAGIGKTTLVRNLFHNPDVRRSFECHAWLSIEESTTSREVMKGIIQRLFREGNLRLPEMIDLMDREQIATEIRYFLEGKTGYIIVFDDLTVKDLLEDFFNHAIPEEGRGRVVVTTRVRDNVQRPDHSIHVEPFSSSSESWLLFCRRAFGAAKFPEHLDRLSERVHQLCGGLPLAINLLAGLLSDKPHIQWESHLQQLENTRNLDIVPEVFDRIVSNLDSVVTNPPNKNIKNCLLYFSVFPRGFSITPVNLFRLWIAEGLIESRQGMTPQKVAECSLKILIDHSLVMAEYYDYGRIRSCKVHDLIYRVIVTKAEEENFSATSISDDPLIHKRTRRLSILDTQEETPQPVSFSKLRTFFVFHAMLHMPKYFSTMKSLRVLHFEGAPIRKFPKHVVSQIHLRYLNLSNTMIDKLPNSLGKLINLKTLNLKGTNLSKLPKAILKLENLQHLLAYHYDITHQPPTVHGVRVPKGIGKLKNLLTLSVIEAGNDDRIVRELRRLSQLQRLGIVNLRTGAGQVLCETISNMNQLQSLSVTSKDNEPLGMDLQHQPMPPLNRLYLRGQLQTLPPWFPYLHSLERIRLRGSRLGQDSLAVLQGLPNLAELSLIQAYEEELHCMENGFQNLRILDLDQLSNLRIVSVIGAMPGLKKMIIRKCEALDGVPQGIQGLSKLEELHLFGMPQRFIDSISKGGRDREMVAGIPVIRVYKEGAFPELQI